MKIDDLTIREYKELSKLFASSSNVIEPLADLGSVVFIRTLTYHYIGKVVEDNQDHIVLNTCSWVADSGEFTRAINEGVLVESEFIGNKIKIMKNNMVDCIPWEHDLPIERI